MTRGDLVSRIFSWYIEGEFLGGVKSVFESV